MLLRIGCAAMRTSNRINPLTMSTPCSTATPRVRAAFREAAGRTVHYREPGRGNVVDRYARLHAWHANRNASGRVVYLRPDAAPTGLAFLSCTLSTDLSNTLSVVRLDRIWMHPGEHLIRGDVHRSSLGLVASDHCPLIAELSLSP
jgi:hypothetical protein